VSFLFLHSTVPSRRVVQFADKRLGMVHSNHGSFCFNQLAALQVMVGDSNGAKASLSTFFKGAYMGQIAANGDQVGKILSIFGRRHGLNLIPCSH
jgi:hypothetical protein